MYLTLSRINCDPDDPEDRIFKIAWRKKFQIIRKIDEALSVNSAIETGCAVFLSSRIRHYPPWGLITHSDRVESENAVLSLLLESFRLIKRTGNAVEIGSRITWMLINQMKLVPIPRARGARCKSSSPKRFRRGILFSRTHSILFESIERSD